ncbi:hypothetical protein AB0D42_41105 [Streptomyces sp. NPDC048304]|uniref:hypothetical protein n=1 Tax=Streptomyces sp. NPDC048304 TaxID=3154820 RepID=UPI0033E0B2E2
MYADRLTHLLGLLLPRRVPRRRRGPLVAYFDSIEEAKPLRPMTPAKRVALAEAKPCTCPEEQCVA